MTSAYILVAAVLVLGGIIAALGDRLGSKVGKARLRLFHLRPRQTAVVITVMTGIAIAATTLGLLFGLSRSLRDGVWKLDDILRQGRLDVARLSEEKYQIQQELERVKQQQETVTIQLDQLNQQFQLAQEELGTVTRQITQLRQEREQLKQERQALAVERQSLALAMANPDQGLTAEQEALATAIQEQDQQIAQLDQAIATQNLALQEQEAQRQLLMTELAFLQEQVKMLDRYSHNYQVLQQGNIALFRGQVLASKTIQAQEPTLVQSAIDQLLRQANETVREATGNSEQSADEQMIQITELDVTEVIKTLQDGQDYIVRIISAENYLQGATTVNVFADVTLNELIFTENQAIASVTLDNLPVAKTELQHQLDLLLYTAQFRSRQAGILGEIHVEDGKMTTLTHALEEILQLSPPPDTLQAIVIQNTSTIDPLKLRIVALRQGEIIFQTTAPAP